VVVRNAENLHLFEGLLGVAEVVEGNGVEQVEFGNEQFGHDAMHRGVED
jgi:hypothetical protein